MKPLDRRTFLQAAGASAALAASGKTIIETARAAEKLEGIDIIDVHGTFAKRRPRQSGPRDRRNFSRRWTAAV